MNFDFDSWMKLHEDDPEEFDRRKKELLLNEIQELAPDAETAQRLEAALFSQESALEKFTDPVARFNEVQRRFYMQVGKFKTAVNSPEYLRLKKRAEVISITNADQKLDS